MKQFLHRVICDLVEPESKVLEVGCSNGDILELLIKEKKVKATGLEINDSAIYECVAKGLSVYHGDVEEGLTDYADNFFDFVIMDETIQELRNPEFSIDEALRVGKKLIITLPNFAYYKIRFQIFFKGKLPITKELPYEWYNTPNLRIITIKDFKEFCQKKNIKILKEIFVTDKKYIKIFPNFFAAYGVFLLT